MMLTDGYHDVPAGHVAMVVTYLEMRQRAPVRPEAALNLALDHVTAPSADWYRALYRKVGGDYLWFGRLEIPEEALAAIIGDPDVEVYALRDKGKDVGLLELDFRQSGACELAYFGLAPSHVGGGAGRWMMNRAIAAAWARDITRFHVHTCTLDHPAAVQFYERSGFTAYRRQVEIAPDPRLIGYYDERVAPNVPIIR